MTAKKVPSRTHSPQKSPSIFDETPDHPVPGAPRVDAVEAKFVVDATLPAPLPSPFATQTPSQAKRASLAGRYRVREGYQVAHGARRGDTEHAIGQHPQAKAGEVVELSHEDAVSVIRLTKDQKDPKTGRSNGPAIESEMAYTARVNAEAEHKRFMEEVNGVNALDALAD